LAEKVLSLLFLTYSFISVFLIQWCIMHV
jgi:hypothetical protein